MLTTSPTTDIYPSSDRRLLDRLSRRYSYSLRMIDVVVKHRFILPDHSTAISDNARPMRVSYANCQV